MLWRLRLVTLLLAWLLAAVPAVGAPKPKTPAKARPQVVTLRVHVVQATSDRALSDIPVVVSGKRRVTDEDGDAVFPGLKPGQYRVSVVSDEPVEQKVKLSGSGEARLTVPIELFVWLNVAVQREDVPGGLRGASVIVDGKLAGLTDAYGQLRLRVKAGQRCIKVTHPVYSMSPSAMSEGLSSLVESHDVTFVARPITGRIRVRVVTRAGGATSIKVHVVRLSDGQDVVLQTDDQGVALSEPLLLGRYRVAPEDAGGGTLASSTVDLEAPGETWLTLQIDPATP